MDNPIAYKDDVKPDTSQIIRLYERAKLRRPIHDAKRIGLMIENANLVISAWSGELLVGIARTLTDFSYVAYLSDLAVDPEFQRQNIGIELIKKTKQAIMKEAKIVLLAAPSATKYYPHIGMKSHPSAWVLDDENQLK